MFTTTAITRTVSLSFALLALLPNFLRAQNAQRILDASAVEGGVVVVIGCDDSALLAELRAGESYLVHGLDVDSNKVANARSMLSDRGVYGAVTVAKWDGRRLPFVDNFVKLIVLAGNTGQVTEEELRRVLAPLGVIADARVDPVKITRKSWPGDLDDWTHFLYDASNNAVSGDRVVAPPKGLRWTCGPDFARSHEHMGSVSAMVSAAGRVFYIIDEGPISSVFLPPKWKLVARDAFSGVLLWQREITNWESHLRGFRSGPPDIGRRLVVDGRNVYVALGYGEPVTVIDGSTGTTSGQLPGTHGARELLLTRGVLYVLADDMAAADHDKRKQWIEETAPTLESYQFPPKALAMDGHQRIVAVDVQSRQSAWTVDMRNIGKVLPTTMAVADDRICLQTLSHVVCLNAGDGTSVWRNERPVATSRFSWSTPTLVVHGNVVLTVDRLPTANANRTPRRGSGTWILDNAHQTKKQAAEIIAFALDDGKPLWRAPCFENYDTQTDLFVIDDVVWVGDVRHKQDPGFTMGRDLRTGSVVREIPHNGQLYDLIMGHHRCYRNKATVRYLLLGRDGIEFVDPKNGTGSGNWWVRGTCQYGILPANGLIYAPQHSCACHPAEKLIGFNALSPQSSADVDSESGIRRLEKGPAFGAATVHNATVSAAGDWPTFRRDARRSGFQNLPAPGSLSEAWSKDFSAPVTAPVVAYDTVFFAETDRHTLHALRAKDGEPLWTRVIDGRIDSPPTIAHGYCLVGTRSGFVYCLRVADGQLAWRFRAAPLERQLYSYGQLESAWPVHGSVLVDESSSSAKPLVYFAAGRSSHLDGGIYVFAVDLNTGVVRHRSEVEMSAESDDRQDRIAQRVLPDILSLQRGSVFMRDLRFDKELSASLKPLPHLYAPAGFLDHSWWHRTYWIYGTQIMSGYGGWPKVGNMVPAGRLLAFDEGDVIYGYSRMAYRAGGGHVHPDAAKDYRLFAELLPTVPPPNGRSSKQKKKSRRPTRQRQIQWSASLPFVASSIVLTSDGLVAAGGQSLPGNVPSSSPGTLWVTSRQDGSKMAECRLASPPIQDGMALCRSGIYLSAVDGSVVCLRANAVD